MSPYSFPGLPKKTPVSYEKVINAVSELFNIPKEDILKRNRKRELVTARHTCFYLLRKHSSLSLKQIGMRFKMDHTSVINGVKVISGYIDINDPETLHNITQLQIILNSK